MNFNSGVKMFNQKKFKKRLNTLRNTGIVIIEILILSCLITVASADTWTVDDSGDADFTIIQEAIDAAEAGDTIEVRSGTYSENVDIHIQLLLIGLDTGEGKPEVNTYGLLNGESPITITADGCTVEGFNVIGIDNYSEDGGIKIGSSSNTISDNIISFIDNGGIVLLESSNDNTITRNEILYNDNIGIWLHEDCNDNQIIDNSVCFNIGDAINLRIGCNHCTLTGNNVSFNEKSGIYLHDECNDNFIIDNEICFNKEIGIYVHRDYNTLTGNTVSNNNEGIILACADNCTLRDNSINDNIYNFNVEGGNVNDIDTSNTINGKPIYYLVDQSDIVIDPSWNAGYIGVVDSHNIIIKDVTITNNGQGILFDCVNNSIIENVNVMDNIYGMYFFSSHNNTLNNNNADSNKEYGLLVEGGYDNSIDTSNTVNGKSVYYFYDIHDQTICDLNTNHLTVANSSNLIIEDININGGDGINLFKIEDSEISNNIVSACFDGIKVMTSDNNIFADNMANMNGNTGINIYDSHNNFIANNTASENEINGIFIHRNSSGNNIEYNYADENRDGIVIKDAENNIVSDNHAKFNDLAGIRVTQESTYNKITNNEASFNDRGICVQYSSSNNIIRDNTVSDNERCGFSTYISNDNEFIDNIISSNGVYGVFLSGSNNTLNKNAIQDTNGTGLCVVEDSNNNRIYNNNFMNNNIHSSDNGSNNWDNGPESGGNYWSGHICNGNPSDGDQPYNIDEYGIDNYPFEDMDGWY